MIELIATIDPVITVARTFDAPREVVWSACTRAELVAQWWGRRDRATVVRELNVRPGGTWRIHQHESDSRRFLFRGTFLEIVPGEQIVNTFLADDDHGGKHLVETHTFEDERGGTRLTTTIHFESVMDRDAMLDAGMDDRAAERLQRLASLLSQPR